MNIPPLLPPPLLPPRVATPPPLPPGARVRQKKPVSPGRRWARRLVWATLAGVLTLRWFNPPDPNFTWRKLLQNDPPIQDARRFNRPPARVRPAQKPIPADLWRLEIEIAPADVNKLRSYQWNRSRRDDGVTDRPEVLATVREGTNIYHDVALHPKGSMGSFRSFDDKPALTLNFSKHVRGQNFHGLAKISLNNSVQDGTYVSEALCRELFVAAGVPVPQATHATAVINGRDLGVFVVLEGWGKPFLRKHFSNVDGNLYEGAFAGDVDQKLSVNSGDQPEDHSDLDRLLRAIRDRDRSGLWTRLTQVLDVDRFATMLALEVLTCHWDGYSLNRNNYRIFHDRTTDRLVFLPHGMDQLFGSRGRMSTSSSILPPMRGIVSRAFMATPEGRKLYLEHLMALRTNLFVEEKLVTRAHQIAGKIRPTLEAYGSDFAAMHTHEVNDLCARIAERCRSVAEQVESLPQETRFDAQGHSQISGWKPRGNRSDERFQRVEEGGRTWLRIRGGGATSGSWRAQVVLQPGEYLFEGIGEIQGADPQGGIRLRLSGIQPEWARPPAGREIPLQFQFEVTDPMSTIELICELGGATGTAAFDEGSLRLTRQ